jgi:hypothetical protein
MGLSHAVVDFLIRAKADGVQFDRTLTLGRQAMFVSPVRAASMLKRRGLWRAGATDEDFYRSLFGSPFYAGPFFRHLGATTLDTMDYAPYEGATVIQDLNLPIPDTLRCRYDVVLDAGTLEHVFNFPQAIRSCMSMVKVGGHFIGASPANGYFGHGLYQFSPELYFRLFSLENGYRIEKLYVCENDHYVSRFLRRAIAVEENGRWYEVSDPAAVHRRVLLARGRPVMMFVLARRTADVPLLRRPVLQSDYVTAWDAASDAPASTPPSDAAAAPAPTEGVVTGPAGAWAGGYSRRWVRLKHLQLHVVPRLLRALNPMLGWWNRRGRSLANRSQFKPVR